MTTLSKARSTKLALRGHAKDRAGNDGSPWPGHGLSCRSWNVFPHRASTASSVLMFSVQCSNWWPHKVTLQGLIAALIERSQSELEGLQKIWVQAYKSAWHVPWSTATSTHWHSQQERMAMSAPCRQKYSRRPCCSTLTNACGMKML